MDRSAEQQIDSPTATSTAPIQSTQHIEEHNELTDDQKKQPEEPQEPQEPQEPEETTDKQTKKDDESRLTTPKSTTPRIATPETTSNPDTTANTKTEPATPGANIAQEENTSSTHQEKTNQETTHPATSPDTALFLTPKPLERQPIRSSTTQELRVELGTDGITSALLGSLSSRSTASARGRRNRPRLGPIKQGTKSYLARSIVPILIEGLTQLSIVRPTPSLSTMGPHVWLANFLLERSTQANDYEIKRLNVGLNIRTQTMYDEEYKPMAKTTSTETQTRLGGREAQVSIGDGTHGMAGGSMHESGHGGLASSFDGPSSSISSPSLIEEIKELASLLSLGLLTMDEFSEAKKLVFKRSERMNATPRVQQQQQQQEQQQQQQQQQQPPPLTYDLEGEGEEEEGHYSPPRSANSSVVLYGEQNEFDQMFDKIEASSSTTSIRKDWEQLQQEEEDSRRQEKRMIQRHKLLPEGDNNDVRAVFMALDHRGTGVLSTLDLLHELPKVVTSPTYKHVLKKKPQLDRLSKPNSFKQEIQRILSFDDSSGGGNDEGDGSKTIDLKTFTAWMTMEGKKEKQEKYVQFKEEEAVTAPTPAPTPAPAQLDLRRPGTKRISSANKLLAEFTSQGLDLRRPSQKRKAVSPAVVLPALTNVPASSEHNQRLKARVVKRAKKNKVLNQLYNALDVRETGSIKKTDIYNALELGTNTKVNSLLSYHEELLLMTSTCSTWKDQLLTGTDDQTMMNGRDFQLFATAVLSTAVRDQWRLGEEVNELDETKTMFLSDRIALERHQWNLLSDMFETVYNSSNRVGGGKGSGDNGDDAQKAISKESFLAGIENNEIESEVINDSCLYVLKYTQRFKSSLEQYKTVEEGRMTLSELSTYVAAVTHETVDDENVVFGEISPKYDATDDY